MSIDLEPTLDHPWTNPGPHVPRERPDIALSCIFRFGIHKVPEDMRSPPSHSPIARRSADLGDIQEHINHLQHAIITAGCSSSVRSPLSGQWPSSVSFVGDPVVVQEIFAMIQRWSRVWSRVTLNASSPLLRPYVGQ